MINASENKNMKFSPNIRLPKKSILGFKVLSSFHSSIACYFLLIMGRILNPLFGFSKIEIIAGSLFNIILNFSVMILTINLISKRKEINKTYFLFLNSTLFLFLPFSIYIIFRCTIVLFFFWIVLIKELNLRFQISTILWVN